MNRNPFGWDLPPGCSLADIERHFGDPPLKECKECGNEFEPEDDEKLCVDCIKLDRANDADPNQER